MAEQKTAQAHLTITDITDGVNANIWTTSTAPTTPNYTFTISNLTGSTDKPRVGDIILQGVYRYTITSVSSTTVLAGSRQSLQGASGAAGGKWYTGTGITGTSTTATIFSGSGVSSAVVGDMYLNTSTDNVYRCTVAGAASAAKWVYTGNIKGSQGNQGRSVTKVETEYYRRLSGGAAPTASSTGSTTIPDYVDGCTYYTRTITYFNTGDPDKSSWVENTGLTNENKNAYDAWIAAGNAELKVAKVVNDSSGVTVASGINGAAIIEGTLSTYGYNTIMAPNYLGLRYNAINLAKLTTTGTAPALEFYIPTMNNSTPVQGNKGLSITANALTFYNPSDNKAQLIIGANGVLQSGNYVYTSGIYSDSGTKIDLTNGSIYTPGFRTDGSNTYIRGEVNAVSGKIGNNSINYWTIGNSSNYDQTASAALISHGTAFIQLDTSNTWRLSTDRIHTAWNGTDGSTALMFPKDGNTYWDWGIHSPHKTGNTWKDKFVYARKYTNTTNDDFTNRDNLTNDIDDDVETWIYQFYIDKNGSIYARNFYLLNEDGTPGSNIGGQDAVYLLKTGGTVTGSLEVNGTLTKGSKKVAYFTNDAENDPIVSGRILIADGTVGGIRTSSYTIAKSVPSNAIFTDQNVKTEKANTTKIYLVGTSTDETNTGTLKLDSNVYLTTTAGVLHATTFEGNLSGTATKANQDSDGNVIKTTYLKLSGGNVTGPVTFGSSVSIDELTVGDLVVSGAASFTNNLQVNTINGVSVGSSPKFTDTVTTVTVTGNGNAITAASASNGVVTLTKGTTFLTSYTETDPIFVASAAHGITSTDISNWNSKTSNTGTVTSVRVQASSPLTSTTNTASSTTLDTTIKFANQNKNLVLAGPSSGNAAAPTFRSLVAADIPNLSWNKITSDKPTTLSGYGITDAAGSNAIVGLSASSNSAGVTTFTATRASGTNPLSFEVSIVASAATGANALKDSNGLISKGSEIIPVYFSNGVPAEANTYAGGTAVTLNGSGKGASTASFYAPTTAGTTSQVLIGGGNAPTWTDISNLVPSSATSATYATYDASESSNTTKTTIANKYVKKSGDTMTNILTLYREGTTANNYPAGIKFSIKDTTTGQTYSNAYIFAYQDHGSTTYGSNMVICSGGGMFIGSGESPANHYSAKGASYTGEEVYFTSDGGIYIQSNGNTIANRIGLYLNASHEIVPCKADTATNNIGSIGTSTYKWANIYATTLHGALDGNATSATKDGSGNTITSTYVKKTGDTMSADLNFQGSTNDSPDIVWKYSDGTEKMRIWAANEFTSKAAPSFREYKADGTQLYSGNLVLGDGTGASGTWEISIDGNATTATSSNRLAQNTEMTYGWSGINYFNITTTNQSAAKVNDTPFSSSTWTHILRFNHANNSGYYTDLAIPFNANGIYYKRIQGGSLQNSSTNGGWVNVLDQLNYTNYTVTKTGSGASGTWGISISGNAATATKSGISTIWLYPENSNEINIGGTSTNSIICFGYRAKDSRPIPSKIVFGGSTGSTELQASSFNMINKANMHYDSTLEAIVFSFA